MTSALEEVERKEKRRQLRLLFTFSAILLTVSSLMTVELLSVPLRGTISAFKKSSPEWERLRKRFELMEVEQKLTCHFILVGHLSGQFLHGDVIERAHDDDGPLEISCRRARLRVIRGLFLLQRS